MSSSTETNHPKTLGIPFAAFTIAVQYLTPYQQERFEQIYGRSPQVGDPFLFDPHAETPTHLPSDRLQAYLVESLKQTQADPILIREVEAHLVTPEFLQTLQLRLNGHYPDLYTPDIQRHPLFPILLERVLTVQTEAFRATFGYEPQDSDPLFFENHDGIPHAYVRRVPLVRLLELLQAYLNIQDTDPTLLSHVGRITHAVVMTTLSTIPSLTRN